MQKRDVHIILVLSFVAITILVLLQIKWTTDTHYLYERQFEHRVTLALNEAINDISISTEFYRGCTNKSCENFNAHVSSIEQVINWQYLEEVLDKHFHSYDIGDAYNYSLFNVDKMDCPSLAIFSNRIYLRPHDECFHWQADEYQLGVFFPGKGKRILASMFGSIAASTLLLLFVVFAFYYMVSSLLKQKKLSEVKNDFINNMTHELKTPMSTISMAAEVLKKANPEILRERIKRYAEIISEENLRLKTHVDHILKSSMLQKKDFNLQLKQTDVHKLIRSSVDNMLAGELEKQVDIRLHLEANDHVILADKLHMANIITNLIQNAVKYSGDPVEIQIFTQNTSDALCIQVKDNGMGIEKVHQKQVFEKFYRVSSGNVQNVKGFGLGLYYVKEMIRAHNGEISLESEPEKGSTFTMNIPLPGKN